MITRFHNIPLLSLREPTLQRFTISRISTFNSLRKGLSKTEVICLIGMIGLLLAVGIPGVSSLRETSRRTGCANNLRALGVALDSYHDAHQSFPAAAIWRTDKMRSLALNQSRRFDLFDNGNWVNLLLSHIPETASLTQHADRRQPFMNCASDSFNTTRNPFVFSPTERVSVKYARGNYAMNAGSNCFDAGAGSTSFLTGDHGHLRVNPSDRTFEMWGNGVGGFNVFFSREDFVNGASSLIALEEVRAGVHALDPRGVWSLGQIGGSITWGHGVNGDAYGPNNQHPRSDDIINCGDLHEAVGTKQLTKLQMPCVSYIDQNFQATSRSMHRVGRTGGVNVLLADGSTKFLSDTIDASLWHVMHSRETPIVLGSVQSVSEDSVIRIQDSEQVDGRQVSLAKTGNRKPQTENLRESNSLSMTFVLVPAGSFLMGRPDNRNAFDLPPEAPPHRVELTEDYYLSAYEVTRKQWQRVMRVQSPESRVESKKLRFGDHDSAKHRSATSDLHSGHSTLNSQFPITDITWDAATEFCRRLSDLEEEVDARRIYRLPTEAEWEFASRGGKDIAYDWYKQRLREDESGETGGILPPIPLGEVGRYPANELGLFDMRGNAWEWCSDWFARDYYSVSETQNPRGPEHGFFKVVRGNDWTFVGEGCKISYATMPPWKRNPYCGFRVVMECGMGEREMGE